MTKTYVVTGATRGLGLSIATQLAALKDTQVVLAVRDLNAGQALAKALGPHVEARALDVGSLADVARFTREWRGPLAGLVNNAGLQQTDSTRFTAEGLEETMAVNYLGAFALTRGLLPFLEGGRVLFIGSGTHNPENRSATRFGFRGARFTSIEQLAAGQTDASDERQAGMDRYATSKFLDTVCALEWSRRVPAERTLFLCLDPGLMPGTGLARTAPVLQRLAWNTVLHLLALAMPDTSTPKRSGAAAVWLMTDPSVRSQNGACFSYDRRASTRLWSQVTDPALGARVFEQTEALLDGPSLARVTRLG